MPIRRWLPLLLLTLAALACQTLAGVQGAAAPYHGAFDCYGTEGGLGAYAGRVTINADGSAVFRNFDDETQTGSWTRDQSTSAISFAGTDLSTAVYNASADSLAVIVAPSVSIVHAEGGSMECQRAQPGVTGPP